MDTGYLWDSWLDKLSWLAVFGMGGLMVYMISTRIVETGRSDVIHSPQARLELKYVPRRSPEVEKAIKMCGEFFKKNKADELIALAAKLVAANPKESFGYMYLGRGYSLKEDYPNSLSNYRRAVEMNPDFVDKTSPDKIGKKYLIPLVRKVVVFSRSPAFKKIDNYKSTLKNLYYLQRRMAGGCE
jgi:tetratricopeptide (TPR) repeat protein